jgi:hypothetical protein
MITFAILAGVLLFSAKKKFSVFGIILDNSISKKKIFSWMIVFITGIFILWGYVFKTAFYTPYNTGVQGDNFHYLSGILGSPHYYSPRHLIFPWIGGQFILFAEKIGILDPQSHLFRFKAMGIAAVAVRIFSIVGLIYLFRIFKLFNLSFAKRIFGVLFLATTFGYWLWSIQPNSLATALGLQCVALYYSIKMIKGKSKALFILSPLSVIMVLFAHISAISFVITLAVFLGVYIFINNYKNIKNLLFYMGCYAGTLLFAGVTFLYISAGYFNVRPNSLGSIKHYIDILIGAQHYGSFEVLGVQELLKKLITNIGLTLLNFFGFWAPQNIFDYVLIFMILALACALFLYISANFKKVFMRSDIQDRWIILMLLLTTIVPFIFFMLKTTTMHYYVIALVPNVVLFLFLIFKTDKLYNSGFGTFLLFCFIPLLFLFNGFSSMNVLKGMDYSQSDCYKKFDALYHKYPKEKIYFYETYNEYKQPFRYKAGRKVYFFQDAVTTHYVMLGFLGCFNRSFPNIEWIYPVYINEILDKVNRNQGCVIIGPTTYAKIKDTLPFNIEAEAFKDNRTGINFYLLQPN